jgi:hypothetical protein
MEPLSIMSLFSQDAGVAYEFDEIFETPNVALAQCIKGFMA